MSDNEDGLLLHTLKEIRQDIRDLHTKVEDKTTQIECHVDNRCEKVEQKVEQKASGLDRRVTKLERSNWKREGAKGLLAVIISAIVAFATSFISKGG